MNAQRIRAGGVIGGAVGLAVWYLTQRALSIEFLLWINLFRYATFWLVGGIIVGGAVGLAVWYLTQRALNFEFPLWINLFRYATFWLVGGIIVGVATAFLRR
jgi:sulfite exporter TauE/SafE